MGKKLHVGNLTYSATSSDLQGWFTPFGTVQSPGHLRSRHGSQQGVRFRRDGHGRPSSGSDPGTQ